MCGLSRASTIALLLLVGSCYQSPSASPTDGAAAAGANRLTYLDSNDPFYVGTRFPKLTTPQWIGEPGVEAVVILAVDDMTEAAKYETFLRPILNRLKLIDGRAPVSIMTRSLPVADPQAQKWLAEGLSLEVHTVTHPCPLLANGDFAAAAKTYFDCVDLLNQISGNQPVAFRMPCCDSQNSTSPRFFAEIFNRPSPRGNFLTIDSSVMNLFTSGDAALPPALVLDSEGQERFRRYFPSKTNAVTRVSLDAFSTTIENYPYPYVIGKLCWEFPCAVPSDWEAFNLRGPTNQVTVADWQAGLDATVLKQGAFTMVFHPHGWIRGDQLVDFVNYATTRYGNRVKFLTFREAYARLNQNLLAGQSLRGADGQDNGVRLLDLNNDGYLDVVIGNGNVRTTRIWQPAGSQWTDTSFPTALVASNTSPEGNDLGVEFGIVGPGGLPTIFFRNEDAKGAWHFDGSAWLEDSTFFSGLNLRGQPILTREHGRDCGVRLRDIDNDGRCELLLGNESRNAIFSRASAERSWERKPFGLPLGTSLVDAQGQDNGLRFVDLNQDGFDDIVFSNEKGYSLHMFISKPKGYLGWEVGWSYLVRSGTHGRPGDIPAIVRGGSHPNNGAWFHSHQLCIQNEDTTRLPDHVWRASFDDLQQSGQPSPKTPVEALETFRLARGFKIELVAAEPLVLDPVAFDWGPDGRLWVVEMRDYPLGMDGKGKPGGVIRVLEDTDGDGRYDKSTLFLDGLSFPNGLLPWRNGLLVSAAPDIIYAEDTDGDGKADVRQLLFTGFREGNQQHRVNGFDYGLDNWVYAANGGSGGTVRSVARKTELELHAHDLRLRPDEGLMELQPGPSQFGRHRDDWGNWFGNENSRWLYHYFLPDHYLARNPYLAVSSTYRVLANDPDPGRIFAISRPQQRFNWPTHIFEVTSACSPTPNRDDLLGPEFASSVFICEPANNVVHREVLEVSGVSFTSHRAAGETNSEFLASSDNWFRPTMVKTGPDGALYVADMYRLIIEHPEYFPEELKQRPDLRAGEDKGRIYRIYPANASLRKIPRLDRLNTAERVAALNSSNGWQRDTLQRLLVQSHDLAAVGPLEELVRRALDSRTRLQALCTLEGLHSLTPPILAAALSDGHYAVRRQALLFAEPWFGKSSDLDARLLTLVDDPDPRVRYQFAFGLGDWSGGQAGVLLARLALKDWADEDMQTALLSSAPAHIAQLLPAVLAEAVAHPVPDTLVKQCLALATLMSNEPALAGALQSLGEAPSARFASWQIAGAVGLLDGLEQRNLSLAFFASVSGPPVQAGVARLSGLFVQARRTARDPRAPESERLMALRMIGREPEDEGQDLALLGDLLDPHNSIAIQQAAFSGLSRATNQAVAEVLIKYWRKAGPVQRQQLLNILFSRSAWLEPVLTALEDGRLSPEEIGAFQQQRLLNHPAQEIQGRASKLFSAVSSDRRKVIERYRGVAELNGDRSRGHALFLQNCSTCHALQGEGHNVGPDLGSIADKPVQTLVVAILDPNQAVDPAYTAYSVTTVDDRELSGILVAETPNSISLRMPGGVEEVVLRSKLKEIISSRRSPMPEGFETGLKPKDLADLIAYISSAGNTTNP